MQVSDIVRMRVRLQRLNDARITSGWVTAIDGAMITVDAKVSFGMTFGEAYFCEIASNGCRITFTGRLCGKTERGMQFMLEGALSTSQSQEDPRIFVENLEGLVKTDWTEFRSKVIDISKHGMAIESNVPLEKDEELSIEIWNEPFTIHADGVVRYCRKSTPNPNVFRIGVKLNGFDRLNTAKWRKLFQQAA